MERNALYMLAFIATLVFTGYSKHYSGPPASVNYIRISYTGHTYLSEASDQLAAAVAGNKIDFADGECSPGDAETAAILLQADKV